MSPRGGKREGAGRPSRGLPTTKVTVYQETRDLLNQYAKELDMPVVELMYRLVNCDDFKDIIEKIKD